MQQFCTISYLNAAYGEIDLTFILASDGQICDL